MTRVCPNCNYDDLHITATVRAILHSHSDYQEVVHLDLLKWTTIESVESYECLNCGYRFCDGNKS